MRRLSKWVLACGSAAAIVGINPADAGPFGLKIFRGQSEAAGADVSRSNTEVANAVAQALQAAQLTGQNIQIEVQNGTAILKGQIADARQKAIASQAVQRVAGVVSVDNQMTPMTASPAAPTGIQQAAFSGPKTGSIEQVSNEVADDARSNQQVATSIAKSLAQAGLAQHDIKVRFKSGMVNLVGDVSHPMEAVKAQQVAYSDPAVTQVINELTAGGLTANQIIAQIQQQQGQVQPAGYVPPLPQGPQGQSIAPPQGVMPTGHHHGGIGPMGAPVGAQPMYNGPNLPNHAWPSYAPYDNYAAVTYPSQYDASAWPYIGPFYPYPQVPMGWRDAKLSWDDGSWNLKFNSRTDKWWWFLDPHNWD